MDKYIAKIIADARALAAADADTFAAALPADIYGDQPDGRTVMAYTIGRMTATIAMLARIIEDQAK